MTHCQMNGLGTTMYLDLNTTLTDTTLIVRVIDGNYEGLNVNTVQVPDGANDLLKHLAIKEGDKDKIRQNK